ncbi:MAG: DUF480 domain-containing protein [Planctomycetales bacterium]|nr:DUF480 domain-containing protein [Planctomycetales bacterium]
MDSEAPKPEPQWKPLTAMQRRVIGVLLEKAKTTPASYPMTLNSITTGCNQLSNRAPVMSLEPEDVEDTLEELRLMGAVGLIEGSGRVSKYRHYVYEWFDVTRQEAAVLAELLLRGEQTVGELRGRAARMEKNITDVAALRPLLDSLMQKRLVISLSPAGRGQIVTHGVYPPDEMPAAAQGAAAASAPISASAPPAAPTSTPSPALAPAPAIASPQVTSAPCAAPEPPALPGVTRDMYNELQLEVAELRAELARVRRQLEELEDLIR